MLGMQTVHLRGPGQLLTRGSPRERRQNKPRWHPGLNVTKISLRLISVLRIFNTLSNLKPLTQHPKSTSTNSAQNEYSQKQSPTPPQRPQRPRLSTESWISGEETPFLLIYAVPWRFWGCSGFEKSSLSPCVNNAVSIFQVVRDMQGPDSANEHVQRACFLHRLLLSFFLSFFFFFFF